VTDTRTIDDLWTWLSACVTCGKPHQYRVEANCDQGFQHAGTWADPGDGHAYRRRVPRDVEELRAEWDAAEKP